ncbi:YceI family protein [Sphingomonas sp. R86521]|uniref:YceI family protein n=1 Tax=Sphingomonas sp. R86521 TaxID=3093860 RepID=UPI0036D27CF6
MKIGYFAIISLALAGPLAAQVTHSASDVQAGTYRTDPNHTLVAFDVNHFGFSEFFGVFPRATGTLELDPKAIAKTKLDISLPVEGVSTTNSKLDEELRSADWFDVAKYPTIRFVSTTVTRTGVASARIAGTVTMHGVTKPLVLDATFGGAGVNPLSKAYTVGFKATGHVRRTDFGVSKYAPLVGDEVTITIAGAFEKAS